MPPDHRRYRFGPFRLDPERRRLVRGADPVHLPDRSFDVLLVLAAHAGRTVPKDTITDAVWPDFAVTDNCIVQSIRHLRQALGVQDDGRPYVETLIRKGYRMVAQVEIEEPAPPVPDVQALLDPFRALADGRTALETLDRDEVIRARDMFADVVHRDPGFAAAQVGMANACLFAYESTRADIAPDHESRRLAAHHAREACRLDPASGHAWSTLALVCHADGLSRDAIAAARKAIVIRPNEWRHYLRLAHVSWGGERLEAACHALTLCPGLAMADWLAATVFVARGAFDVACEYLSAGAAAQDAERKKSRAFAGVGLHWLHGLVLAARASGDADSALDEARAELQREIAGENPQHLYGREIAANSWYALGALALRQARGDDARAAFLEAIARVPGHALANAGLSAMSGPPADDLSACSQETMSIERATVVAAGLACHGRHADAARICADALQRANPGAAGWLLPVEPLLHASARRDIWDDALGSVRDRAF